MAGRESASANSIAFAISRFLELIDDHGSALYSVGGEVKRLTGRLRTQLKNLNDFILLPLVRSGDYLIPEVAECVASVKLMFENLLEDCARIQAISNHSHLAGRNCSPVAICLPQWFLCWSVRPRVLLRIQVLSGAVRRLMYILQQVKWNINSDNRRRELPLGYKSHVLVPILKEEMDSVISYLESDGGDFVVVSITGMGGVGKSALARQVLDHPRIHRHFEAIWIDLPRKFERKAVLQSILGKLEQSGDCKEFDYENLATKIRTKLENSSVLLVLDGICSPDDWESLRIIIPSNIPCQSKILMTTRMDETVLTTHGMAPRCIHLRSLATEQGSQCLLQHAKDRFKSVLSEDLAKKIVQACGGLPLTIASFLGLVESKALEVHDIERFVNASVTRRLQEQAVRETAQVLVSSYYNLPHALKLVFLYMGVLQQNCSIEFLTLNLFCLADGIISPKQLERGKALINLTEQYVRALAHESMLNPDDEGEGLKYCHLNILMRDLSILKNKDEFFCLYIDYDGTADSVAWMRQYPRHTIGRVAINLDECEYGSSQYLNDVLRMQCIRVLIFTSRKENKVWPMEFLILDELKYLTILYFSGFNFEQPMLPEYIKSATYLRYLSFKGCIMRELPASIVNLAFLYILDLRVDQSTPLIIPNVLWKMKKLRHLFFPILFETRGSCKKLRLDSLTELETITNFNTWMFNVEDLLKLHKLQHLDSTVDGNLEEMECIVRRMMSQDNGIPLWTSLEVRNFHCYTEERHLVFRKLLACQSLQVLHWNGHLRHLHDMPMHHPEISQNLSKIVFIGSGLTEDPMQMLDKLPKLRKLVLDAAYVGTEMICSQSSFAQLKSLEVLNLANLEKWTVESGAMPKLATLVIRECTKLEMLSKKLWFRLQLRKLDISRMSDDFKKLVQDAATRENAFTATVNLIC